ncbi:Bardet-Biedl syndrome 1 [Anticarsia gemmatalis]|uniref:Bardet-Biedl syndrome 1 n=1 Tax=Anticarsia gemmatalis TaxID=129554 RepID=UPI003F76F705
MGSMTRWLDVEVGTDDIDLNTLPPNLALVDLHNDNEIKLLIGDLGRGEEGPKLKVFKGAMQISDTVLPDYPLGVVGFYISETVPRSVPIIAVAYSSCVYMYRNLKLFYKYYLPSTELSMCEIEVWKQLTNPAYHSLESIKPLTDSLRSIPHKVLTAQSQHLLTLTPEQQLEYVENNPELPSKRNAEIVCIGTLKLYSVERYSVSCLVVATEDGDVMILDPQTFTPLAQTKICAVKKTPYQMITTGLYNVDYRITVATREKSVCVVKRDWNEGRILFNTDEHIIAIEVVTADNSVMVICTDNTMACYSKKGKKLWCITLEHRPVAMTLVPVLHLGVTLTGVALASGHVHLYDNKARRDTIFVRDVVSVMKFGQLGQEEHVLIIVTGGGSLMLKILKRTAEFSAGAAGVELSPAGGPAQRPWLIPKKSKLFLEQSVRERENAVAMHETFQHELNRLRLLAARTLVEAHVNSDNSVGTGPMESMRLTAEVEGLGPVFRVTLIIENKSKDKAVIGLSILFHVHTINYKVSNPYIKVPLLSPGGKLKFPTKVEEVFEDNISPDVLFRPVTGHGGERALVKILLLKEGRKTPVLAATVQMPPTDPMMLPFDKMQAAAGIDPNEDANWLPNK